MGSQRRSRFRLNKVEGKVMGVCSGLADHFNVDVTLVRVAATIGILMTFPVGLFAYLILAMVAQSGGGRRRQRQERAAYPPRVSEASREATRERMRDLDARMQAIETYVTSSNTKLAQEIDSLR